MVLQAFAQAPDLQSAPAEVVPTATPAAAEATVPAKESSDYEVDYEEEPGADEVEEPVQEKPKPGKDSKKKGKKSEKESVLQGSRAEKRIAPLMKSETKSIYKKNGKALDVDTD